MIRHRVRSHFVTHVEWATPYRKAPVAIETRPAMTSAGIALGESIQRDMIAVRVSRDHRLAVVGSPEYFASHAKPSTPRDVLNHRCINLRGGSARAYRWEFEKNGESVEVDVTGPMIFDDADLDDLRGGRRPRSDLFF